MIIALQVRQFYRQYIHTDGACRRKLILSIAPDPTLNTIQVNRRLGRGKFVVKIVISGGEQHHLQLGGEGQTEGPLQPHHHHRQGHPGGVAGEGLQE